METMFELLFLIGLIGLGLVQFGERIATWPCFPSLLFLFLASPVLYMIEYERIRLRLKISVLSANRPIPPERFYWVTESKRLLHQIVCLPVVAAAGWVLVFSFPSSAETSVLVQTCIWNWIGTFLALVGTAPTLARISIYFRAAQHFSRMQPAIVGWFRRKMAKFSDNPDYLENEPEPKKSDTPPIY